MSTLFRFFTYFSIIFKLEAITILLVVINPLVVRINKVGRNLGLYSLEKSINIRDIGVSFNYHSFNIVWSYRNNDLFSWGTFSCYVELWFTFLVWHVNNFMSLWDFVGRKFWEDIFNFYNILDVSLGCLGIR